MTGDISQEQFYVLFGPTASGKSTFIEALSAVLGDYATAVSMQALLTQKDAKPDEYLMAHCFGKRMVFGSEWSRDSRLNEALVKLLTGGDTLPARRRYGHEFKYDPQFKIMLGTNEFPRLNWGDGALMRRIVPIHFPRTVAILDRDPSLKASFKGDEALRSSVLSWAVEGAVRYFELGEIRLPDDVEETKRRLAQAKDPTGAFISECLRIDGVSSTSRADLDAALEAWCLEKKVAVKPTWVVERLLEQGVSRSKRSITYYDGVALVE